MLQRGPIHPAIDRCPCVSTPCSQGRSAEVGIGVPRAESPGSADSASLRTPSEPSAPSQGANNWDPSRRFRMLRRGPIHPIIDRCPFASTPCSRGLRSDACRSSMLPPPHSCDACFPQSLADTPRESSSSASFGTTFIWSSNCPRKLTSHDWCRASREPVLGSRIEMG